MSCRVYTIICNDETPCSVSYFDCAGAPINVVIPVAGFVNLNGIDNPCVDSSFGAPTSSQSIQSTDNGQCEVIPSPSPTPTISPTPSVTPTPTISPTPSVTPTSSITPTPSLSPTQSEPCVNDLITPKGVKISFNSQSSHTNCDVYTGLTSVAVTGITYCVGMVNGDTCNLIGIDATLMEMYVKIDCDGCCQQTYKINLDDCCG
jgi:hypothetical protein